MPAALRKTKPIAVMCSRFSFHTLAFWSELAV